MEDGHSRSRIRPTIIRFRQAISTIVNAKASDFIAGRGPPASPSTTRKTASRGRTVVLKERRATVAAVGFKQQTERARERTFVRRGERATGL